MMFSQQTVITIFEQQQCRRLSVWQKIFLGYYLGMGPGLLLLALIVLFVPGWEPIGLLWFLGLIHSGLFIWFLMDIRNDRLCAGMMLEAISDGGQKLAWIYQENEVTLNGSLQTSTFHYWFTNKKHSCISGDENLISNLMGYFTKNFHQISSGYSVDLEKTFLRSPQNLKTHPARNNKIIVLKVDNSQSNGW